MAASIHRYETYWEDEDGQEVLLAIYYEFFPAIAGKRDRFEVPLEPDEGAVVEIYSIKTLNGAYPRDIFNDWDEDYAIDVITSRIMEQGGPYGG